MHSSRLVAATAGAVALTFGLTGCTRQQTRTQLERVAKGWCETIRASQVIPVYPLTEDLEPGDVFLVQTSIQAEADVYQRKGFLPLDDRRTRLRPAGYDKVYADGYWADTEAWGTTPHPRHDREGAGAVEDGSAARLLVTPAAAPRVAFPSYSFEVRSSGAFGLALPIKGVPVGLSLMRADRATGTVTIADGRTYAGDPWTLYEALETWAARKDVRPVLSETVAQSGRPVFVRVVTRVYLTGAVFVSLRNRSATAGGGSAGQAPDVPLLNADGTANENAQQAMKALSEIADPSVTDAGARVKFVTATSRDVVLAESFDRLLAVGYLGFDVPVYEGGYLGAPIPTYERLEGLAPAPRPSAGRLTPDEVRARMHIEAVADTALAESVSQVGADAPEDAAAAAKRVRTAKQRAAAVMKGVTDELNFTEAVDPIKAVAALPQGSPDLDSKFASAAKAFRDAANRFVAADGAANRNDRRFCEAIERVYGTEHGFIKP